MKHFKIWQAPVLGFFSTRFYRDLAYSGKGVGFLYLLALLSVSCLVEPVREFCMLQEYIKTGGKDLAQQFPTMKIQDGVLTIDQPSPYTISVADTALVKFYADEKSLSEISQDDSTPMIVTQTELSYPLIMVGSNRLSFPFKGIQKYTMDKNDVEKMFTIAGLAIPALHYLFTVPLLWLAHMLQALIYSIPALLVARLINVQCSFGGLVRVASVAVGCAIIIATFLKLVPLQFPGINDAGGILAQILLAGGYTLFGTGASLSQPDFEPVTQDEQ